MAHHKQPTQPGTQHRQLSPTYFVHAVLFYAEFPSIAMGGFWSRLKFLLLESVMFLKDVFSYLVYVDVFLVPGPLQGFGAPSLFLFAHIILERKTTSKPHTHDCEHKHTNEQNTGKSLSKKRKSQAGW